MTFVFAAASALLHFVWQGLLLGACIAAVRPALRPAPAWIRFAILYGALLGAWLLVVITFAHELSGTRHAPRAAVHLSTPLPTWPLLVVTLWSAGVSLLGVRMSWAWFRLRSLRATGLPLPAWKSSLRSLAARLGIERPVALGESPAVDTPVVIGWWRPMILVPLGFVTRLRPDHVEAILAHELAHVRRHDVLLNLVQSAIEVLLFYHPVVWWLSSQIREAREACCDDLVIDVLQDPLRYAVALTELESTRSPVPAMSVGAKEGNLMQRIRHIVSRPAGPVRTPARAGVLGLALTTAMATAIACVAHEAQAPENADPAGASSTSVAEAEPPADVEQARGLTVKWLPDQVTDFEEHIVAAARRHGVDPELVAIMVFVESRGQPTVRSPGGARGLMQIMPATATQIALARGLTDHTEERLDDPEYNLDLGTWYLAEQLRTFGEGRPLDEAVSLAAAAYNGGPRRLEATLRGEAELSEETRRYQSIVSALWTARNRDTAPTLSD